MDTLSIKTQNRTTFQNILKDPTKCVQLQPKIEELDIKKGLNYETSIDEPFPMFYPTKSRNQHHMNKIKWGSLKKFLYKKRILLNKQLHPSSKQIINTKNNQIDYEKVQFIEHSACKQGSDCSSSALKIELTDDLPFVTKEIDTQLKKQTFVSDVLVSIPSPAQFPLLTAAKNANKSTNNESVNNNIQSTTAVKLNQKERKLISVKTNKQPNLFILRQINKSQLNTTMSDDQQSYEEEIYKKVSSSFRNNCELKNINFDQRRSLKVSSDYCNSFLENSQISYGCPNFLYSPSLNNSDIFNESLIPERCQNPLSKDIQFLNLANNESNFLELKQRIQFDEDLFDYII